MAKNVLLPVVSKVTDHTAHSATVTVEPLHTGYGMTLGNSLRRVLLSSIPGAAITGFKVEGITHEFTTVAGVKEDAVEIMLNLKGIRFRVFDGEIHELRLSKKGKGVVTAADITTSGEVEIVNPDAVICTIDDASAKITLDLRVEVGRGYRSVEEMGDDGSDYIRVDALFSPVLRVRYNALHTRVGQTTDLDKLEVTIDTDGSITPRDAFENACSILIHQYASLAGQTAPTITVAAPSASPVSSEMSSEDSQELMMSIEDLNLSARTTNALINNEIHTLKDLFMLSDTELRELKGFGSKALDEVKDKLAELEL